MSTNEIKSQEYYRLPKKAFAGEQVRSKEDLLEPPSAGFVSFTKFLTNHYADMLSFYFNGINEKTILRIDEFVSTLDQLQEATKQAELENKYGDGRPVKASQPWTGI